MNAHDYPLPDILKSRVSDRSFRKIRLNHLRWSILCIGLSVACWLIPAGKLSAQDFEADSIYYTPISKTSPVNEKGKYKVFNDTLPNTRPVRYYFDISVGTVVGCVDCPKRPEFTFTTSTTHGVTLGRKARAGLGAGFDTYAGWQTLPLFGSLSFDLFGTRNTHAVVVQLQYGWALAWYDVPDFTPSPADTNGGPVLATMLGYRLRYHNLFIVFTAGFKQQSTSVTYESENWTRNERGEWVLGRPNRRIIDIEFNRLSANIAFSWRH